MSQHGQKPRAKLWSTGLILSLLVLLVPLGTGASGQGHIWTQVAVLNFSGAGSNLQIFNSTFKGSTGLGLNFTVPNPSWNLPFNRPVVGFTNIILWITGWVIIRIGSPDATSSVTVTVSVAVSTIGVPTIGQPANAGDDIPPGPASTRFGPSNPLKTSHGGVCGGTTCQSVDTLPLNMYREAGCVPNQSGQCIVSGTVVFVYLTVSCNTFFIGAGIQTANSCHYWGTGSNGWDLGNATIGAGKLQVFA